MNIYTSSQNLFKQWQPAQFFKPVCGLRTSFYGPKAHDVSKKTVLLIHGLGGDYHGMLPFGYEARLRFNVYIVELPGHGDTDIPADRSYTFWQRWAAELAPVLRTKKISIDHVVAHSFGCNVAAIMAQKLEADYTFLNPVPRVTIQYLTYVNVMHSMRYLISPTYGWYPLALWRGIVLSHQKTRSFDTLSWISHNTRYLGSQLRYQLDISMQFKDQYLFSGLSDRAIRRLHIVMGSHDTFSTEDYFDLKRDISHARITLLPGGHLLPIETPYQASAEVFSS